MNISMNTDFLFDVGCCEANLEKIARAGFTHVHWCHHWHTDFLYSSHEILEISRWLKNCGLELLDLHGSSGIEKNWRSHREHERLSGVDLVKNRIDMTARLGGDAVVMHATGWMVDEARDAEMDVQLIKSLDELETYARNCNIRIAIENLAPARLGFLSRLFDRYSSDFLCFCFDSGHRNIFRGGENPLKLYKERLGAVHLHDNDGSGDQHRLVFDGNIDWEDTADLMADSAYTKCINLELSWDQTRYPDESHFLSEAYKTGTRLAKMIQDRK